MPLQIFLVEDNATIRDNLLPALADLAGGEVIAYAETEVAAEEWLDSYVGALDLVIIDLLLKNGSGFGVLRHFKAGRPDAVLVILSNYATPVMRERATSLGATCVFDKSIELEAFFDFCAGLNR